MIMRNMKLQLKNENFLKTLLVFVFALFISLFIKVHRAYAAYDGSRLIDNGVFLDASSMSSASIQKFLVDQGGGIANQSFLLTCGSASDTATRQAYTAYGAPCGQTVPASQIIYYASQIYGVNPRVILATMQKEQSLVTAANPTSWQVNQAMGYGCPDSGGCGASNFFYQIDNGTWVLRYHYERANGNNTWWNNGVNVCGGASAYRSAGLYAGATVTFIDDAGVSYRTYTLANAATAAFYCYTPHAYNNQKNGAPNSANPIGTLCYNDGIHPEFGTTGYCYTGSFNFVYWFEKWFASTRTPDYAAKAVKQSGYPTIIQGQQVTSYFQFKNTGSSPWYDDITAWNNYQKPVRLATDWSLNRASVFGSNWQPNATRASIVFASVFEPDGTTLAPNQHIAQPGQIVQFNITLAAPINQSPGFYAEAFRPVVEGYGPMNDTGTWMGVTVQQVRYTAQFGGQSSFPTIVQGQKAPAWLTYKNTGNVTWYDDVSGGAAKQPSVHLATDWPLNRTSPFSATWPYPHRAAVTFGAVYEADGTTLAANQHTVSPGQFARFNFDMTAPLTLAPGFYGEAVRPVVQGLGPMNDTGTWMGVTVTK